MSFENKSEIIENKSEIIENKKYNTFRYKLSEHIIELIKEFTSVHKYDDRKTYKESWKEFCDNNNDIILRETNRLTNIGYKGDIINVMDKMYKAGRYYFIKKNNNEKKEQKKRRIYICMDSDIIYLIDEHIKNNIKNDNFKPRNAYDDFYEINKVNINEEIERLKNTYNIDTNTLNNKIKKTYKNRYYIISRNNVIYNNKI